VYRQPVLTINESLFDVPEMYLPLISSYVASRGGVWYGDDAVDWADED